MPQQPKIDLEGLPDIDIQGLPDQSDSPLIPSVSPVVNEPSLWERISVPLTDAPSRWATSIADSIDMPSLERSPLVARMQGFGAGALQGLGDLVSGLTSPINLATTLLTAGSGTAIKAGMPGLAKIASLGAKGAGALTAAHGAGNVLSPESTLAERGQGLTEIAGGILGMRGVQPKSSSKIGLIDDNTPIDDIFGNVPDAEGHTIMTGERVRNVFGMEPKEAVKQGHVILDDSQGTTGYRTVPQSKVDLNVPDVDEPNVNYLIRKEKATPDVIKKAQEQGYEFTGSNDRGDFRFKKGTPKKQPILENEVSNIRPKLGPVIDEKRSPLVEAFNLPRALMASIDFSAPLRQGLPLIHKKEFWNSVGPMFKSWASEDAFRANQQAIAERPLFKPREIKTGVVIPSFADEAGLKLSDLTSLSKREESLMSTWAEKVPGVRRSNRAYTAFLNNLRADTFESLVKDAKIFGTNVQENIPLARSLADFVNTASGRGSLGKLESSAVALNSVLFSPRLIASRLKMLNPAYYVMAPPQVRKEALKSLFAIAAVGNTVTQLGRMAGGTVESDPASSDFGKLRIGNTRIDPFGGFQQYIVAANRLLNPIPGMGQRVKSSTTGKEFDLWNPEKPFDPTHASVAGRFAQGKLHPTLAFAWNLLSGAKEMSGEPMNFGTTNPFENAISQRFIPIVMQDIYETAQENPKLLPITVPLSTFGMSTQSYGQ